MTFKSKDEGPGIFLASSHHPLIYSYLSRAISKITSWVNHSLDAPFCTLPLIWRLQLFLSPLLSLGGAPLANGSVRRGLCLKAAEGLCENQRIVMEGDPTAGVSPGNLQTLQQNGEAMRLRNDLEQPPLRGRRIKSEKFLSMKWLLRRKNNLPTQLGGRSWAGIGNRRWTKLDAVFALVETCLKMNSIYEKGGF